MKRFWNWLTFAPAPKLNAKPGPSERARDHQRIIETMRQMRFELGMPWRI